MSNYWHELRCTVVVFSLNVRISGLVALNISKRILLSGRELVFGKNRLSRYKLER